MLLSLEGSKDRVVSGLEQYPRHGGALTEGSHKLLLWLLSICLQEG